MIDSLNNDSRLEYSEEQNQFHVSSVKEILEENIEYKIVESCCSSFLFFVFIDKIGRKNKRFTYNEICDMWTEFKDTIVCLLDNNPEIAFYLI